MSAGNSRLRKISPLPQGSMSPVLCLRLVKAESEPPPPAKQHNVFVTQYLAGMTYARAQINGHLFHI